MLVLKQSLSSLSISVRWIHTSSQTCNLIAPPDSVSHMRPIIYDDAPLPPPPSRIRHPYSLSEFAVGAQNEAVVSELQYRLQRQQLDAFHHNFWFDSNTRFEAAKKAILGGLPTLATPLDKEKALSAFYKQWHLQESKRTDEYTKTWRKRNMGLIMLGARVEYQKLSTRISKLALFKKEVL
ncbi:hypothetical protein BDZ94DRAFT_1161454 [Collybia nuda]|uniref:Uncharacterized protein n=1 Tax=Collybia nuda TaxID=64659 RepID=A0A9P5Y9R0_9AGAR|nr:hypothetical protein BDZ94DRAFT_1161454 [Collybia nuda]